LFLRRMQVPPNRPDARLFAASGMQELNHSPAFVLLSARVTERTRGEVMGKLFRLVAQAIWLIVITLALSSPSYAQACQEYAQKVAYLTDQKKRLREAITNAVGDEERKNLEMQLESLRDEYQMATVDLQSCLQKEQELLQQRSLDAQRARQRSLKCKNATKCDVQ